MDNMHNEDREEPEFERGDGDWETDACPKCGVISGGCDCDKVRFYSVAVVLHDKAEGGPEEGGWWYDTFNPVKEFAMKTRIFESKEEAYNYRDQLRKLIKNDELNKGRHDPSSVISDGHYEAHVFEDDYPHYIPRERPHYE